MLEIKQLEGQKIIQQEIAQPYECMQDGDNIFSAAFDESIFSMMLFV